MERAIQIVSTAKYLPEQTVTSEMLDEKLGLPPGWSYKSSRVRTRWFVTDETSSQMGAYAAEEALRRAGLAVEDIDCIISVSGTMEQPIPCHAALIHQRLTQGVPPVPAFDINSTCLSFITGLDLASHAIQAGQYHRVLFVASEIASIGLNWEQKKSSVLFGDGAAAVVVQKSAPESPARILASRMETYSQGADYTRIRGGGTRYHSRTNPPPEYFLFDMDGKAVYRMVARYLPGFVDRLLAQAGVGIDDLDLVIPHQASGIAMELMRKKLGIREEKYMTILEDHGNVIAASLPMALHEAVQQGRLARGSLVLMLGTSAGTSLGGVVLAY
ncbi:beta-ketoacyl-ACP synthase III [Desmospora profundinema]|uniref:3-oxoacyl-[acyl-carrier-protein] synthase-3 n=1 Tax=Desmospora profundinema TaxID=1571184 RepID=A0ABU1IN69_9BACL|nr:beta-ketoacyl-ACP synthase III [Desmospora profundinema]MDR6226178.1 3-oxoacyl-[acyl-carrier-protein] synthase-3 [Desmospora profundinema]